jgi:hypothetical protein
MHQVHYAMLRTKAVHCQQLAAPVAEAMPEHLLAH